MAAVLIQRQKDDSEQFFLSGVGWVPTAAAATSYASMEAALSDGETQREMLGRYALLTVKDMTSGDERPVPSFNNVR